MKAVEASAKTREEAIQNALKELGVEMYEVDKIEVLDEGSKGLFGLGARPVRVRLIVENMPDEPQRNETAENRQRRGGRGRGERGPDREQAPQRDRGADRGERGGERGAGRGERNTERAESGAGRGERNTERAEGGADRERGERREGRNGRGARTERDATPREGGERPARDAGRGRGGRDARPRGEREGVRRESKGDRPAESQTNRGERDPQRQRPERPDRNKNRQSQPRAERPAVNAPEGDTALLDEVMPGAEEQPAVDTTAPITDEQGGEAAALLAEIIVKMGITATTAFVRSDDGSARINVSSEDSAILIGRKGRNLSAMQYLINRMISRNDTSENTERIVVDVEGYVDRRRESLQEMALSMASKAKETQRNMRLKPLSPQERRIIHLALQDDEEIRTFSLGDSLFRSVVISPKNAVRPERPRSGRGNRGGRRRGGRGRSPEFSGRKESQDIDVGALGD